MITAPCTCSIPCWPACLLISCSFRFDPFQGGCNFRWKLLSICCDWAMHYLLRPNPSRNWLKTVYWEVFPLRTTICTIWHIKNWATQLVINAPKAVTILHRPINIRGMSFQYTSFKTNCRRKSNKMGDNINTSTTRSFLYGLTLSRRSLPFAVFRGHY